ncbi:aldehyde reductase [Hypoxylon rubiginosum]|uniref:Aldehyde reductase n=1 Tax=Hypoxylon rubiginosum TaxID=110542 RepID=A0ACB9YKI6_9PEZI|nr:aldehyde reductase [Hypoxylon rubiginosum]
MALLDDSKLLISPGSLVVVTGANGFIATHILDQLLQRGYRVRGTVRSVSKNQWVKDYFEKHYGPGKIELVEVPDMTVDGVYDDIVKGASGFVHVAAPLMSSPDPHTTIPLIVDSTLRVLEAAAKEPGMKRVVLTSSSGSCVVPTPNKVFTIDSNMWNEDAVKAAYGPPSDNIFQQLGTVYAASKTKGEQAAWQWMREHKPPFALNTIIPNANLGPPFDKAHQGSRSTLNWIGITLEKGETVSPHDLPGFIPQHYVDVRDCAALHVAALIYPDVNGERLFAFAAPFAWNDFLRVFKKTFPDRKFSEEISDQSKDLSKVTNERAEELVKRLTGHGWKSLQDAVGDAAKAMDA